MVRKVKWWQSYCYYHDRWSNGCCVPVEIVWWIQSWEDIVSSLIQHCISSKKHKFQCNQLVFVCLIPNTEQVLVLTFVKTKRRRLPLTMFTFSHSLRGPHGFKLFSISDDISPYFDVVWWMVGILPSSQSGYRTVEFIKPFMFLPLLVSCRCSKDLDRPMTPFVRQRTAWRYVRSTSTDWLFTSVRHVLVTG